MQDLKFKVNEQEYEVEFTFRSSQCDEIKDIYDFFTAKKVRDMLGNESTANMSESKGQMLQIEASLEQLADANKIMPKILYVGLVQNHGKRGKITQDILSVEDAIELYADFCDENSEDELSKSFVMLEKLKSKMEEDGFFERIGLSEIMKAMSMTPEEMKAQEKKFKQEQAKLAKPVLKK